VIGKGRQMGILDVPPSLPSWRRTTILTTLDCLKTSLTTIKIGLLIATPGLKQNTVPFAHVAAKHNQMADESGKKPDLATESEPRGRGGYGT